MKIPGHLFCVGIGYVEQIDSSNSFAPVGDIEWYRMQRADLKRSAGAFNDTSNFGLGFESEVTTNRRAVIKVSDFEDDQQNLVDLSLVLVEGALYRMCLTRFHDNSIFGQPEAALLADLAQHYLFTVVRLAEGGWSPDANSGQPVDLTFNTVRPYTIPGELSADPLTPGAGYVAANWSFNGP